MTETGLNAQIRQTEALRIELLPPSPRRHTGAAYRREMQAGKNDALARAVSRRYIPGAPYVDRGFGGPPLLHSGYYIKYLRSSKKETPQTSHRQALPAGTFASVEGESIPQSPEPLVDSGLKRDGNDSVCPFYRTRADVQSGQIRGWKCPGNMERMIRK